MPDRLNVSLVTVPRAERPVMTADDPPRSAEISLLSSEGDPAQALGFTETTLLIFGVGFLPVAVMVGISYALWAGLCAAFIAYEPQGEAPDRMNRVVRRTI